MSKPIGDRKTGRILMQVLWPAFLMSIVAEGLFFSTIDPRELEIVGVQFADSREAAYTVGFFVFWILFSCSSGLTYLLAHGSRPPAGEHKAGADRERQDKALLER